MLGMDVDTATDQGTKHRCICEVYILMEQKCSKKWGLTQEHEERIASLHNTIELII
jgi:hypothetical protein